MSVQLTQQDINTLKAKGISQAEIDQAISEIEKEDFEEQYNLSKEQQSNVQGRSFSGFKPNESSNDIARWQLELNDILEKTEHILRGDIVVFQNGKQEWHKNPEPHENTLNEKGVQLCMKLLSFYINRNTILSDFTEEQISYKVLDFGKRLNNLIFVKYDEMGMDTEEKRKEYASLVGVMVDVVHSAYARAKDGRERESYRKMISVSENTNGMVGQGGVTVNASGMAQRTRGLLNPMRYVAGKYV